MTKMSLGICPHRLSIVFLGLLLWFSHEVASSALYLGKQAFDLPAETLPALRATSPKSDLLSPSDGNQLRANIVKAGDFVQQIIPFDEHRASFKTYLGQDTENCYYSADLWQYLHHWRQLQGFEGVLWTGTPLLVTKRKMSERGHVMLAEFMKNMLAENDLRVQRFYNWLMDRFPGEVATFDARNFYNLEDLMWNFVIWAKEDSTQFPDELYPGYRNLNIAPRDSVRQLLQWAEKRGLYKYHDPHPLGYPAPGETLPLADTLDTNDRYFKSVVERVPEDQRLEFIQYMNHNANKIYVDYAGNLNTQSMNRLYDRWAQKQKLKNGGCFDRIHYHLRRWLKKLVKFLYR